MKNDSTWLQQLSARMVAEKNLLRPRSVLEIDRIWIWGKHVDALGQPLPRRG